MIMAKQEKLINVALLFDAINHIKASC